MGPLKTTPECWLDVLTGGQKNRTEKKKKVPAVKRRSPPWAVLLKCRHCQKLSLSGGNRHAASPWIIGEEGTCVQQGRGRRPHRLAGSHPLLPLACFLSCRACVHTCVGCCGTRGCFSLGVCI
uniref:Uncharacterized protein n=1 Tax=Pipistrellus kuhlii TaxID=59472 RepID=A0A7J7ZIR3_PIPKU|nr:hypothetical protein mPipKuh1_009392 [Pipistrellus kuhlii]